MTYKLRYGFTGIERGEFTKEDAKNGDFGLCDALVLVSIVEDEQGNTSTQILGRDGRQPVEDDNITDVELFKVMSVLCSQLKDSQLIAGWQRRIAVDTFEKIRDVVLRGSGGKL